MTSRQTYSYPNSLQITVASLSVIPSLQTVTFVVPLTVIKTIPSFPASDNITSNSVTNKVKQVKSFYV